MDRTALLVVAALGAAAYLLRRQASPDEVDQTILDARDAWAQSGDEPPIDQTIWDARDAWASTSLFGSGDDNVAQYDAMGNVISVSYWGDAMRWTESVIPAQYLQPIRAAEARYGLPRNMLARLLYQESHFRPDIISGQTKSSAGALGIAQFMPATAAGLGIDPLNPLQAIDAAANYLGSLYKSTGMWSMALAAYNWGLGNLRKYGMAKAPAETRSYYQTILTDIGISSTTA